ncbi:hypothetical protein [Glaciibacter superstes]|uniref:hypothetical protein n=1 Tax=Glaciibacter superstes TaxID=501023 RepID=UPI0003B72245|nr:hypothetical protein [Glaciibacter superstes]
MALNFGYRSTGAGYLEATPAAVAAARTLLDVHRLGYLGLDTAPGWAEPILEFVVRARAIDPQVVLIRFLPGTDLAILFQSPANRGELINEALDESLAWRTCSMCGRRGRTRVRGPLELTACRSCWKAARRAATTALRPRA